MGVDCLLRHLLRGNSGFEFWGKGDHFMRQKGWEGIFLFNESAEKLLLNLENLCEMVFRMYIHLHRYYDSSILLQSVIYGGGGSVVNDKKSTLFSFQITIEQISANRDNRWLRVTLVNHVFWRARGAISAPNQRQSIMCGEGMARVCEHNRLIIKQRWKLRRS